jgi:uncharacterized membrane protein (DUF485 family)
MQNNSLSSAREPDRAGDSIKAEHHDDNVDLISTQARSGLALFAVYFAAYGFFMGIAAFKPDMMAWETPVGPNLAIVYGFGLIGGAVVIALLYMKISQRNVSKFQAREKENNR